MKKYILVLVCFISFIGFAQNNHIVKTEDGRRVLLKADNTWEYIDAEAPKTRSIENEVFKSSENKGCKLALGFEEPELNKKIQNELKKGRATINHIKKKVAKDNGCTVEDVLLLSVSESKAKGIYHFCANGTKVIYKRVGHSIAKKLSL